MLLKHKQSNAKMTMTMTMMTVADGDNFRLMTIKRRRSTISSARQKTQKAIRMISECVEAQNSHHAPSLSAATSQSLSHS